jgi:hypothetical protein
VTEPEPEFNFAAFEAAAQYAETLVGWALLIIGGSVLILLQTSYRRPASRGVRYLYLIFMLGWTGLAASIYFGMRAQQVYLASLFQPNPDWIKLLVAVNSDISLQTAWLKAGLAAFAFWLALYLGWWIWNRDDPAGQDGQARRPAKDTTQAAQQRPHVRELALGALAMMLMARLANKPRGPQSHPNRN